MGLVSSSNEKWSFLGWQIVGMLSIIAWVATISLVYFLIMKRVNLLRVPLLEEIIGLDYAEMGSDVRVDIELASGMKKKQTLKLTLSPTKFRKPSPN